MQELGLRKGYLVARGKYMLVERLGAGGMGEVWSATHQVLGTSVALKFLRLRGMTDARERLRFFREARWAKEHDHIVRVYDIGELNKNLPFIVMERLVGRTLRHELQLNGALPVERTANIIAQVVSAMGAVHSARIIHRDLKPGNIFLLDRQDKLDFVKVLDFGIAKYLDENENGIHGQGLTQSDAPIGTRGYMAPEQLLGAKDVNTAADIWALGVVLYECLAGKRLWANSDTDDPVDAPTYMHAAQTVAVAVDALPEHVPSPLRDLIVAALRIEPRERIPLNLMFDILAHHASIRVPPIPLQNATCNVAVEPMFVEEETQLPTRSSLGANLLTEATESIRIALHSAISGMVDSPDMTDDSVDPQGRRPMPKYAAIAGAVAVSGIFGVVIGRASVQSAPTVSSESLRDVSLEFRAGYRPVALEQPMIPQPHDVPRQYKNGRVPSAPVPNRKGQPPSPVVPDKPKPPAGTGDVPKFDNDPGGESPVAAPPSSSSRNLGPPGTPSSEALTDSKKRRK